ncbi:hypothetical protein [Desertivirga xinjiangensis]|uniref:hypothetical protein n=1 Tax=Desertivirga xinjiangensis TaxID=539206 RepID=UPI00210AC1AF|nr:hypothetical protein [Pedobacter xinjiangensis]
MRIFIYLLLTSLYLLTACSNEQKASDAGIYFDIRGFFKSEAVRLTQQNSYLYKTVSHNGKSETQQLIIADWPNEFALFSESDLNKPSWKNSYNIAEKSKFLIEYSAKEDKLRTRKICISKSASGEIDHIYILNENSNFLYSSEEELNYYPDSLYQIIKHQKVSLLGANTYIISGKFKKN